MQKAATNGGSQTRSSCDRPLCRTVRSPTVHCVTDALPFCCALAIAVLCCPSAVPSCQCVVVSVRPALKRSLCVRLAAAGQAQSDTNSQTADSATVTYKKVFKLFPVHPGSPRGEQCSSSMRALQSLGTYGRTSGALDAPFQGGFLSADKSVNPDFANWTKVFVNYLDGFSFTGDLDTPIHHRATNQTLYFRGKRNLIAVFDALAADYPAGCRIVTTCIADARKCASLRQHQRKRQMVPP